MRPAYPNPGVRLRALALGCAIGLLAPAAGILADDTEVFFGQKLVDVDGANRPNVLFVLDTSWSMTFSGETNPTARIDRLKEAMHEILDSTSDVNVGLMRFNGSFGGGAVIEAVGSIDDLVCEDDDCEAVSTVSQVVGREADAEELISSGSVSSGVTRAGNVLTMGREGSNDWRNRKIVGLSFELDVPQGATITGAELEFVADSGDVAPAILEIAAEARDDATQYTETDRNLSERPLGDERTTWLPGAWSTNGVYQSADIADVVQEVTDRTGWCAGNRINIDIRSGGFGERSAKSTSRPGSVAPRLRVTYDPSAIPDGGGCTRRTTTATIAAPVDDAWQLETANRGQLYNGLQTVQFPNLRQDDSIFGAITGLRFNYLNVPSGATIEEAYITLYASTVPTGSRANDVSVKIEVQDSDDAPYFPTEPYGLTNLPRTSVSTEWQVPRPTAVGAPLRSVDVSALVGDIVARDGWERENAIAFLMESTGGSGVRQFYQFDSREQPAQLHVKYRVSNGASEFLPTKRNALKNAVTNLQPAGATPIAGALYEASRYLQGGAVDFGRARGYTGNVWWNQQPGSASLLAYEDQPSGNYREIGPYDYRSRSHRTSTPDSWTGGTLESGNCPDGNPNHPDCVDELISGHPVYTSPITGSCQASHIILLSDGKPQNNGAAERIEALTGANCAGTGSPDGQCGPELAAYLANSDQNPSTAGVQGINTYTVGFDLEDDPDASAYLTSLSTAGGGEHFGASQTSELVDTFRRIIDAVTVDTTAFASPGASVNQFNRLTHRDDIYFGLFHPSRTVRWPGNLKRYKVTDQDGEVVIKDVNGNLAVDEEVGFFADTSQSFWSDAVDGPDVERGGFAESLSLTNGAVSSAPRKVYTNTIDPTTIAPVDLTMPAHDLSESNGLITPMMLGLGLDLGLGLGDRPAGFRDDLLKWARGVDVQDADGDGNATEIRRELGDPMHSQPVILNYGDTPAENKTTVFIATNQGFLHALDPEITSGANTPDNAIGAEELFTWIPGDLLGNLVDFYDDAVTSEHVYGLDGYTTLWIDDEDNDLTVDTGEKAYVFVGMRRGGGNYYALDVSDRESPKLAWVIRGGTGDFAQLGQSWSRAVPARMQIDGTERNVVIFTGGYDINQDPGAIDTDPSSARFGKVPARTTDSVGRGLFVVDMATGEKLWSGLGTSGGDQQFASMTHGMPSSPEVIDIDFDGLVDQIYASDAGGQLWRFDVTPYHEDADVDLMTGGVIARLGSEADAEQRRFYYEPDVALVEHESKRFLTISIGSGWRAHPLDTMVDDRFYVIRSDDVYEAPAGYGLYDDGLDAWRPVVDADLASADGDALDAGANAHGWYKTLDRLGEKVLGTSLTANNQVTFTTYVPSVASDPCTPALGSGYLYVLDLVSGRPASDLDGDGDIDAADDSAVLRHPGIPPSAVAIITEEDAALLVGTEVQKTELGLQTHREYWTDLSDVPDQADMDDLLD